MLDPPTPAGILDDEGFPPPPITGPEGALVPGVTPERSCPGATLYLSMDSNQCPQNSTFGSNFDMCFPTGIFLCEISVK